MEKLIGLLIGLILGLLILGAIALLPAVALYYLAQEVLQPCFPSLPHFTFFQCFLVSLCLGWLFNLLPKSK